MERIRPLFRQQLSNSPAPEGLAFKAEAPLTTGTFPRTEVCIVVCLLATAVGTVPLDGWLPLPEPSALA
ncbi:MAG: hypothetical protein QUS07_07060 [Methanothrix sp.]|nr:hypothetical protein [Methanothrix sp.]